MGASQSTSNPSVKGESTGKPADSFNQTTNAVPRETAMSGANACPVAHNQSKVTQNYPFGVTKCPVSGKVKESASEIHIPCPVSWMWKDKSGNSSSPTAGTPTNNNTLSPQEPSNGSSDSSSNANLKSGGCPVKHKNNKEESASACPVKHKQGSETGSSYKNPFVYNVYNTPIDPTNQMPSKANQERAPDQKTPLNVDRAKSNIPKGGTYSETWVYPSPQMFWNALVRKNKTEGVTERDIDTVVAIHNNMNENTWMQVLAWENLRKLNNNKTKTTTTAGAVGAAAAGDGNDDGTEPKLLRFLGRPDELSPKARMKMLVGHPAPFDRHDWIVDRGGQEVRYVIDYYHDESAVSDDTTPKHIRDATALRSIQVDVRPALDSISSLTDRLVFMPFAQLTGSTLVKDYSAPTFFPPSKMLLAEKQKINKLNNNWETIQFKCNDAQERLHGCEGEEECSAASIALQACVASVVCPTVSAEFVACRDAIKNSSSSKNKNKHSSSSSSSGNWWGGATTTTTTTAPTNITNTSSTSSSSSEEEMMTKFETSYADMVKCLELFEMDSMKLLKIDVETGTKNAK